MKGRGRSAEAECRMPRYRTGDHEAGEKDETQDNKRTGIQEKRIPSSHVLMWTSLLVSCNGRTVSPGVPYRSRARVWKRCPGVGARAFTMAAAAAGGRLGWSSRGSRGAPRSILPRSAGIDAARYGSVPVAISYASTAMVKMSDRRRRSRRSAAPARRSGARVREAVPRSVASCSVARRSCRLPDARGRDHQPLAVVVGCHAHDVRADAAQQPP